MIKCLFWKSCSNGFAEKNRIYATASNPVCSTGGYMRNRILFIWFWLFWQTRSRHEKNVLFAYVKKIILNYVRNIFILITVIIVRMYFN